VLKIDSVIYS